jgi:hypothetical protein
VRRRRTRACTRAYCSKKLAAPVHDICGGRVEMTGQAVDLLGVENRVALHEGDFDFDVGPFVPLVSYQAAAIRLSSPRALSVAENNSTMLAAASVLSMSLPSSAIRPAE